MAWLTHADVQIARLDGKIAKATTEQAAAKAVAEREAACLAAVKTAINDVKDRALTELRSYATAPPATHHALVAALRLLRGDGGLAPTWNAAVREVLSDEQFFLELDVYDGEQPRDAGALFLPFRPRGAGVLLFMVRDRHHTRAATSSSSRSLTSTTASSRATPVRFPPYRRATLVCFLAWCVTGINLGGW